MRHFANQGKSLKEKVKRVLLFLPLFLFLFPFSFFLSSAYAEEAVDIGEIEVTSPDTSTRRDTTAESEVITPKPAEEIKSTAQLLEQTPGVFVKRYGLYDDFATISIRGAPSNQIATYLDNVPLDSAAGNTLDLSIIPPQNIGRMEVYRGGSPARAPDSAPAGAIFISTPKRPKKLAIKIGNSYGSFTTYKGYLQLTQPVKDFWYLASFEHAQSKGNFSYWDDRGTRQNPSDDVLTQRKNNDFMSENLLVKGGYETDDLSILLTDAYLHKNQGMPGLGSFQSLTAQLRTDRNIAVVNADYKKMHAHVFFDFLYDQLYDPNGDLGLGRQNNDDKTYRIGSEASWTFDAGSFNEVYAMIDQRTEIYAPTNNGLSGTTSMRNQVSLVGEDTITLVDERLSIVPSFRFAVILNHLSGNDPSTPTTRSYTNDTNYYQPSGKLGVKFRMISDLFARGNFYAGKRNPTFSELFGDRGMILGNPELKPEQSINFDLGLLYDTGAHGLLDGLKVEATYFRNYSDDLIQFLQTSQLTAKAENLSKALIQGAEIGVTAEYLQHLGNRISYTYQHAKDTSDLASGGKFMPGRPKNNLWFEMHVFNEWGKVSGEYNFMGGMFLDSQNLIEVTSRNIFNINASATPAKWVVLSASVKNIGNDRTVDSIGFPLPGRSYWGVLTFKI